MGATLLPRPQPLGRGTWYHNENYGHQHGHKHGRQAPRAPGTLPPHPPHPHQLESEAPALNAEGPLGANVGRPEGSCRPGRQASRKAGRPRQVDGCGRVEDSGSPRPPPRCHQAPPNHLAGHRHNGSCPSHHGGELGALTPPTPRAARRHRPPPPPRLLAVTPHPSACAPLTNHAPEAAGEGHQPEGCPPAVRGVVVGDEGLDAGDDQSEPQAVGCEQVGSTWNMGGGAEGPRL